MHVSNGRARLTFRRLGRIYTASSNLHSEPHAVAQTLRRQTCDAAAALRHTRNSQLCLTTTAKSIIGGGQILLEKQKAICYS